MDIDAIDKIDENDDRFQEKDSRENTEIIKFQVANGSQHTAFCELNEKLADVKSEHERLQQKMLQLQMQYEEEILNKASPLTRNTRKRRDELEKLAQGCMEQSARAKAIYADVDKMVCGLQQRHEHMVQQAKTRINGLLEELTKKVIFTPKLGRATDNQDKRYDNVEFTPRLGRRLPDRNPSTPADEETYRPDPVMVNPRTNYFSPRLGRNYNFQPRLGRELVYEYYPEPQIRVARSANSTKKT